MKNTSFSKRVALYYMTATACMMILIYLTIYAVLHHTVYEHIRSDLRSEAEEIGSGLAFTDGSISITNEAEWLEPEHGLLEMNPVFIQLSDNRHIIRKSPNLGIEQLSVINPDTKLQFFKDSIHGAQIYQLQMPVKDSNKSQLMISVAVPLKDTALVLTNLKTVLFVSFPIILILLFIITRYLADKSIAPVHGLMEEARKITAGKYNKHIELPSRQDELYYLTQTINKLIDRLQAAIAREKQFTADASHELRTPLSTMKGSLEVILRKSRSEDYYKEKLGLMLKEVDRMSNLTEQLLLLARYEHGRDNIRLENFLLFELVQDLKDLLHESLIAKKIKIELDFPDDIQISTDWFMFNRILENLLVNAIKFSPESGIVRLEAKRADSIVEIRLFDQGPGIPKEDLQKIFERFYRADESRDGRVHGAGLGLSIVKRFCDLLSIELSLESETGKGSMFKLRVPC